MWLQPTKTLIKVSDSALDQECMHDSTCTVYANPETRMGLISLILLNDDESITIESK